MSGDAIRTIAAQVVADAVAAGVPASPLCVVIVGQVKTKGLRGAVLRRAQARTARAGETVVAAARGGAGLDALDQAAADVEGVRVVAADSAEELALALRIGPPGDAIDWQVAGRAMIVTRWWDSGRARSGYDG